jgi:hypothetical protein
MNLFTTVFLYPLVLLGLGAAALLFWHVVWQLRLWKDKENRYSLVRRWLLRELPIGVVLISITAASLHEATKPETLQEKNGKAYQAFNKAAEPLVEWCDKNLTKDYNYELLSKVGKLLVSKEVYQCFTDANFREKMLVNIVISNKPLLSEKLVRLNQVGYFDMLNKKTRDTSNIVVDDLVLDSSIHIDPYNANKGIDPFNADQNKRVGIASVCKRLPLNREFSMRALKRECYEIDWISYRAFEKYVDDCWDADCIVTGYVSDAGKLVGLQASPASLEVLLRHRSEIELNALEKVVQRVTDSIEAIDDIDKPTWDNIVFKHWKNN